MHVNAIEGGTMCETTLPCATPSPSSHSRSLTETGGEGGEVSLAGTATAMSGGPVSVVFHSVHVQSAAVLGSETLTKKAACICILSHHSNF